MGLSKLLLSCNPTNQRICVNFYSFPKCCILVSQAGGGWYSFFNKSHKFSQVCKQSLHIGSTSLLNHQYSELARSLPIVQLLKGYISVRFLCHRAYSNPQVQQSF